MTLPILLGLSGLGLGLVGSALLAFSLNRVIAGLSAATEAHDLAITGLLDPQMQIIHVTGTDLHVEKGRRAATTFTRLGLWALVVSFALQAASLLLATQ